jgi:hypothetical protein
MGARVRVWAYPGEEEEWFEPGIELEVTQIDRDDCRQTYCLQGPIGYPSNHPDSVLVWAFDEQLDPPYPPLVVPKFANVGEAIVWMEELNG